MKRIIGAVFGLWIGLAGVAHAQSGQVQSEPAVVVELFTSQGCSSCPPADDFMAELVSRESIIPLALHVDYWDYIGWEDKFAQPQFTARQKAYARAVGSRTIYTPQMIVAGSDRVEGFRPMEVAELIQRHLAAAQVVSLGIERAGSMVRITATAEAAFPKKALVQLVRYIPSETVTIERGENAGRTVTYHNIVTSWETIADWSGAAPLVVEARAEGGQPVVVIVQAQGPASILGAARLK